MKYEYQEYLDGCCTLEQYYKQFKNTPTRLDVGDVFIRNEGNWMEERLHIVFTDDKVALAVSISGNLKGSYQLFHNAGLLIGWEYSFNRSSMRLQYPKKN